jgi:hypothetical protein
MISMVAIIATAQGGQVPPEPPLQVLGPQLVAWSQLQRPQPIQQLLPDTTLQRSCPQAADQTPSHDALLFRQGAVLQLKGSIVQANGHYLLKLANDIAIQLDNAANSSRYEGKQVRIAGIFDKNGESFRVLSIELDS